MMENPQGHIVTFSDMYQKIESIDDKVNMLLERDKRDYERMQKLEGDVERLKKYAYFVALPLMLVISIVLGVNYVPPML